MVHCEIKTNTEKVSCRGNPLMKRDVRIEKSTSNREHLLQIGILFSRNAKKTHRDESRFFSLSEKNNITILKTKFQIESLVYHASNFLSFFDFFFIDFIWFYYYLDYILHYLPLWGCSTFLFVGQVIVTQDRNKFSIRIGNQT